MARGRPVVRMTTEYKIIVIGLIGVHCAWRSVPQLSLLQLQPVN